MSSIDQLVKSGILDPDFMALPIEPVTVSTIDDKRTVPYEPQNELAELKARMSILKTRQQNTKLDVTWHKPAPPSPPPQPRLAPTIPHINDTANLADADYYMQTPYHWLYSGRAHGWWHYAKQENITLESKYNLGNGSNCDITINDRSYSFNFTEMTQRAGSTVRNILRVESLDHIALRGVAGSRIQKSDIVPVKEVVKGHRSREKDAITLVETDINNRYPHTMTEMLDDLYRVVPKEKVGDMNSYTLLGMFGCVPLHSNMFNLIARTCDLSIPRWFYDKYADEGDDTWLSSVQDITESDTPDEEEISVHTNSSLLEVEV